MKLRFLYFIIGMSFLFIFAFALGYAYREGISGHEQYLREKSILDNFMDGKSEYQNVKVDRYSAGGIELYGTVPSKEHQLELYSFCLKEFGEATAKRMTAVISVKSASK
jgi:hypothetical protein